MSIVLLWCAGGKHWDKIHQGGECTAKKSVCFATSMWSEEDAVEIVTASSAEVLEAEVLQLDQ